MKKWFAKHFRHISIALICLLIGFIIFAVIHGEYTKVQISCWTVMLIAMVTITINNRKNQSLHEALFSLFYAAFAVELWSKDRSLLWAIPWLIIVPILAFGTINTYIKDKRNRYDANRIVKVPIEIEGKSNG